MKGVIFFAETSQESAGGDIARWTNVLEKFAADYYIVIDRNNIIPNWTETKNIVGIKVTTLQEALDRLTLDYPTAKTVRLMAGATLELKDIVMPANPCFVIGPDGGVFPAFTPDYDVKVYAPNIWAIDCVDLALYEAFRQGV